MLRTVYVRNLLDLEIYFSCKLIFVENFKLFKRSLRSVALQVPYFTSVFYTAILCKQ